MMKRLLLCLLCLLLAASARAQFITFLPSDYTKDTGANEELPIETTVVTAATTDFYFGLVSLTVSNTATTNVQVQITLRETPASALVDTLTVSIPVGLFTVQLPRQYTGTELGLGGSTFEVLVTQDSSRPMIYQTESYLGFWNNTAVVLGGGGGCVLPDQCVTTAPQTFDGFKVFDEGIDPQCGNTFTTDCLLVGNGVVTSNSCTLVGPGSASLCAGAGGIALGLNAGVLAANAVAIGRGSLADVANTFEAGSESFPLNTVYFGKGGTAASVTPWTLSGVGGTGTNNSGGDLRLRGGLSTGIGIGGNVLIALSDTAGSGSTPNTATDFWRFKPFGDFEPVTSGLGMIGSNTQRVNSTFSLHYLGTDVGAFSVTSGLGNDFTLYAGAGAGTNQQSGTLFINGGLSTGNANPGDIYFQTSVAGSSGSTLQSLSTKWRINGLTGDFVPGFASTFNIGLTDGRVLTTFTENLKTLDVQPFVPLITTPGSTLEVSGGTATGLNQVGGQLNVNGGKGTGSGTPGDIVFRTTTAGASSSTPHTLSERWRLKGTTGDFDNGQLRLGDDPTIGVGTLWGTQSGSNQVLILNPSTATTAPTGTARAVAIDFNPTGPITIQNSTFLGLLYPSNYNLEATTGDITFSNLLTQGTLTITDSASTVQTNSFSMANTITSNDAGDFLNSHHTYASIPNLLGDTEAFLVKDFRSLFEEPMLQTTGGGSLHVDNFVGYHSHVIFSGGTNRVGTFRGTFLETPDYDSGNGTVQTFVGHEIDGQTNQSRGWVGLYHDATMTFDHRGRTILGTSPLATTTVEVAIANGDTTIDLVDTTGFSSSGSVRIDTRHYAFSANNVGTGVLTLVLPYQTEALAGTSAGTAVTEYALPVGQVDTYIGAAARVGHIVRGAASQTADLQQWQDSTGTIGARVTADFGFRMNWLQLQPSDAPPTCNAGAKGTLYYDDSLSELCDCDGTSWAQVDGGGAC